MRGREGDALLCLRGDTRLSFTVGSDKSVLNGEEITLPMAVYSADGLPYVPANVLFDAFGIEYTYDDGILDITSVIDPGIEYAERTNARK